MAKEKTCNYKYNVQPFYNTTPYDFKDKCYNMSLYVNYMLDRTRHIFEYENLPDTIPERSLELFLQVYGFVIFDKVNGDYYIFNGGLGGEPDPYYMPTIATIANPALNYSANRKIGTECIIIPNDSNYIGMLPMFKYFATLDVETDISFKRMLVNMRRLNVISSNNDRTTESAKDYLKRIEDGDDGIIAEQGLVEALRVQPTNAAEKVLTDLIEFKQYNKASWLNFIGLNANYNMKREAINSNESQLNDDALTPLIDDMLHCREKALEQINELFGLNISVKLSSKWEEKEKENELYMEQLENTVENPEESNEPEPEPEPEPEAEPEDKTDHEEEKEDET